jgi:hypothetical protein
VSAKHSPGPWRIEEVAGLLDGQDGTVIVDRDGNVVADGGSDCGEGYIRGEVSASAENLRLIAAAPALYDLVERASTYLLNTVTEDGDEGIALHREMTGLLNSIDTGDAHEGR